MLLGGLGLWESGGRSTFQLVLEPIDTVGWSGPLGKWWEEYFPASTRTH